MLVHFQQLRVVERVNDLSQTIEQNNNGEEHNLSVF